MSSVGVEGGGVEGRVGTKSRNDFHNTVPTQQTWKRWRIFGKCRVNSAKLSAFKITVVFQQAMCSINMLPLSCYDADDKKNKRCGALAEAEAWAWIRFFSALFKYWFLPVQKWLLCHPADGQTIWEITTAAEMCVYKITQSDKVSDKKLSLSLSCERFMACLFALSKLPFPNILGPSVFLTSGCMSYVHDAAGIFESAPRQRPLPAPQLILVTCSFLKIPIQIFQKSHPWAFPLKHLFSGCRSICCKLYW